MDSTNTFSIEYNTLASFYNCILSWEDFKNFRSPREVAMDFFPRRLMHCMNHVEITNVDTNEKLVLKNRYGKTGLETMTPLPQLLNTAQ